jgi:hypothetical protein
VLSRCEKTGEIAYKKVLRVFVREAVQTYSIFTRYEGEGGFANVPFGATAEHPFWVKGKGWTPAIELQVGDAFVNRDGRDVTLRRPVTPAFVHEVYNLEVEDFNTYFVGQGAVWVHNCNAQRIPGDYALPNRGLCERPGT